jgi:hypothetical protein
MVSNNVKDENWGKELGGACRDILGHSVVMDTVQSLD